jgi:YesN/AraC family two-component response regulator
MFDDLRQVANFPEYYATESGKVFSFKWGAFRELKPYETTKGYLKVRLYKDGKQKNYFVHRLVMETFKGESSLEVNHIDGNKKNNELSNLEYVTTKENDTHARRELGKGKAYRLTPEVVQEIFKLHEEGLSLRKIAAKVGVGSSSVGRCLKNGKDSN